MAADPVPELAGMPAPFELARRRVGDEVVVTWGPKVLFRFAADDIGMRNLAMVALTDAGVACGEAAVVFGVTPVQVSRIRGRVAREGSAGAAPTMGAPVKLSPSQLRRVYAMADDGLSGVAIAKKMRVSQATISRVLARRPRPEPATLSLDSEAGEAGAPGVAGAADVGAEEPAPAPVADAAVEDRYAGAMLLWPFLVGAAVDEVLGSLPDLGARRYGAAQLMLTTMFALALGAGSIDGARHLDGTELGALVGAASAPCLRTWRDRLGGLAEACDPLAIQRALARGMLGADDRAPSVFFCDDHFVAYTGDLPVAKGFNTRRRIAEPGRDDTFVTDRAWRAVCFASGEPTGLSVNLPPIVDQLIEICSGRPVMIGFDRGGAYPKVFAALADRGVDFVTYRRGGTITPTVAKRRSWVAVDNKRISYELCDEIVELPGYGSCRQISVIEHDQVVFQVLTSDTTAAAAWLVHTLRCRWSIENCFKYLEEHHNIGALCEHTMNIGPDTRRVDNPARANARADVTAAETALADAERALAQAICDTTTTPAHKNRVLPGLQRAVAHARTALEAAQTALAPIPAKIAATDLKAGALRAQPRLARRSLQMVCRLLAYNAELDLARRLNTHLRDIDEYRATARHLLHQPGRITYTPDHITVTLRPPAQPRVTAALALLLDEFNLNPPHMPGDHRPITYQLQTPTP